MSEIRSQRSTAMYFSITLLLWLAACGASRPAPAPVLQGVERLRANACAHVGDGGEHWTGERVKAVLGCVLASSPEGARFENFLSGLEKVPGQSLDHTATWLERNLAPAQRGDFLTQLEQLHPAFGGLLIDPANQNLWQQPALADALPFLTTLLPVINANQGALLEKSAILQGAWSPDFADTRSFLHALGTPELAAELQMLARKPSPELNEYSLLLQTFINDLAPDRGLQKRLALFTRDITCGKEAGYLTRAPLAVCLGFFAEEGGSPARLFASISQAYLYWENTCHLPADLGPQPSLAFWRFLLEPQRYAQLARLARLGLGQNNFEQRLIGQLFDLSAASGGNGSLIARLNNTQVLPIFLKALSAYPPLQTALASLSPQTLAPLFEEFPRLTSFAALSLPERLQALRGLETLVRVSAPDAPLLREWQTLAAKFPQDKPLPLLGTWLQEGRVGELAKLLRTLSTAPTSEAKAAPVTVAPKLELKLEINLLQSLQTLTFVQPLELREADQVASCVELYDTQQRDATLVRALQCITRQGLSVGLSEKFLNSPASTQFLASLHPSIAPFTLIHELAASDPLSPARTQALWLPLLSKLQNINIDLKGLFTWFASAPAELLAPDARPLLQMNWGTPTLPKSPGTRAIMGIPQRLRAQDFQNSEALWQRWLTNEAAPAVAYLLGSADAQGVWAALNRAAQLRVPVSLIQGSFTLDGSELFDLLLWESQIAELGDIPKNLFRMVVDLHSPQDAEHFLNAIEKLEPLGQLLLIGKPRAQDQLSNTLILLKALRKYVSADDIVAIASVLNVMAPAQWNAVDRMSIWLGLHRTGIFPALGRALRASPNFATWMSQQGPSPGLRERLERKLQAPLQRLAKNIQADDVHYLALLNQQLEAYPAQILALWGLQGLAQIQFLPTTSRAPEALLSWLAGAAADLALPLLRNIRQSKAELGAADFQLMAQAGEFLIAGAPLERRTEAFTAAKASAAWFVSAPGAPQLLQDWSLSSSRAQLLPWLEEGHVRKHYLWALLVEPGP